ncbi:50S ribosomal protein L18 [Candidatus Roizmanbacteria bacterium CG02_land_8_20_14_3_00_36_15]|uniref:Large ribosomal subunit protein uL18 n=2 Tax=Candidatus Roizmaniibacteriota TaxID=1752723 RepID=A0A2M8KLT6_9BACT|nr:MAG: 50S ribosomal protein L18 [Candidatus Roizmanbacteria bacterium CG03_land_8_20_14_0_80_36_21]PIV37883.1 MAG: 50S ribosomal protein L18 [Candidatus Roizmanbacteria bacterium CG02_land_8_20_14_3_00_36_15]PIY69853.1 MAG: 50S ribosomal protein L18 [Candidatus Roizmanbacteria bacterium CG_4_10_14_0_8_um_filter_36_36]PJA53636.1 MAG: 50S ribosomal protein L18 [Candidatus Roizmanbacteria bacterium CG_4_9_14_3_um_filter_36_11]PJC81691.1 MAG: 50S ribosomal protein L18 [Candidatus Roizmanbacteria 
MIAVRTFDKKLRRKIKIRSRIFGNNDRPRISVFRSNRYIYAQAINDEKRITLCAVSSLNFKPDKAATKKSTRREQSRLIGIKLAEKMKKININQAIFDRGSYSYHGRVAAVADGLREGGIKI